MKANRKFKIENDEAVSAVIGVILMVAITVAIAATVYVYVSGMIGDSPTTTPNLQMVRDNTNRRLTVASADPGNLKWEQFSVVLSGTGQEDGNLTLYYTHGNDETDLSEWSTNIIDSDIRVQAGDYFEIDGSRSATVSIRHISTNTLIGTWDFT